MEAKELRIGNRLFYEGKIVELIGISGITYSFGAVDITIKKVSDFTCTDIKRVSPVHLTEEILLKCGFEKSGEFIFDHPSGVVFDAPNDWNNTDEYPIEIGISRTVMGYNPEEVIIRCLYLHDLQNKFFAITGEELQVNL